MIAYAQNSIENPHTVIMNVCIKNFDFIVSKKKEKKVHKEATVNLIFYIIGQLVYAL